MSEAVVAEDKENRYSAEPIKCGKAARNASLSTVQGWRRTGRNPARNQAVRPTGMDDRRQHLTYSTRTCHPGDSPNGWDPPSPPCRRLSRRPDAREAGEDLWQA